MYDLSWVLISMDRIFGFEPKDAGSIPAGPAQHLLNSSIELDKGVRKWQ